MLEVSGVGKEGSGLGDMGSSSPRGATRQGGAQRLLAESWRPGGTGTAEAASRHLSETRSGRCRVPRRRSLLVPAVPFEGERSERMCCPA